MTSGVKLSDKAKSVCEEMRVVKNDSDPNERKRIVKFTINGSFIDVEKIICKKDLCKSDPYECFITLLEPKSACYLLYDCHFETTESSKEELVFILWSAEDASIKEKMCYASSKRALKCILHGLKHDLEIHDLADCCTRDCFAEKLGKNTIKIEGCSVHCDTHDKKGHKA